MGSSAPSESGPPESAISEKLLMNGLVPLEGPDVPFRTKRKSNPAIRSPGILAAAVFVETFKFVRKTAWRHAGFGSLRKIAGIIEDFEPLFDPQLLPRPEPEPGADVAYADSSPRGKSQIGYYSAAHYRNLYLSGEVTPTEVAEALLPLIRRDVADATEHSTAFFQSNEEKVMAAARASTQRYQENRSLGPLDGVPAAVKDEYDMDGYRTCLGSKNSYTGTILEGGINTSWCVRKLEEAGAVIIGKTSMHEFGLDTTGNNPIYGTPRNPFNPDYYTGGSSSGTGYAVGMGLVPIGLGSDGGGSIRIPASLCGAYGLKPTHGRLSFKPGQNHCLTCACLGPIASDIESLAAVFQVISQPHPSSPFPPLRPLQLKTPRSGPRVLGIPREWIRRSTQPIQDLVNDMIRRLVKHHDFTTVDIRIPFLAEGQMAHALTVLTDAATLLPDTKNLTSANRILLAIGSVTPARDYLLAQKLRRMLMQHLAWLWQQHPGMLIITPTTACEGLQIKRNWELRFGVSDGDRTMESMEYAWLANFCGLPSIATPVGYVRPVAKGKIRGGDIPVGIMATGEWCDEEGLLQFGGLVEGLMEDKKIRPGKWVDVIDEVMKRRAMARLLE